MPGPEDSGRFKKGAFKSRLTQEKSLLPVDLFPHLYPEGMNQMAFQDPAGPEKFSDVP